MAQYGKYAKAGCENPASSQRSEVISHRVSKPEAAMAGSLTRKIPGPTKAGQDVAGEANQVKITHGGKSVGKQTWKGAAEGYMTKKFPEYVSSPAPKTYQDSTQPKRAKQSVKGKHGGAPSEAKQVAGRKQ